jgi:protein-tyrosine-phosphatase/DNA-binding transcriptional ArsR family regulator
MHQIHLMYSLVVALASQDLPAFVRLAAHPLRWRLLTELADSDYRVRELVSLIGEPQNLLSYHLRLLRNGGLVSATRSSFDGRDSYYHLDLDRCAEALDESGAALHPALHRNLNRKALPQKVDPPVSPQNVEPLVSPRVGVLFVCTGNSARSPIAEALLSHRSRGQVEVASAGIRPRPRFHPHAVRVLRDEFGIDISRRRPRSVDALSGHRVDYLVSLCDKAREACPDFPSQAKRVHWSIPDPAVPGDADQAGYPAFRRTVTELDTRIRYLLPTLIESREGAVS